jgi:putative transposase
VWLARNELHRLPVPGTARFLTFSTYRRLRLFDNDRIKDLFVDYLNTATVAYNARMIAWVVMPEHAHLILYLNQPDAVAAFLMTLKRPLARKVLDRWRTLNAPVLPRLTSATGETHFWQPGGGYDRNVVGDELIEKIRYVHKNPITRGLSPDSVSWRWSSAAAYRQLPHALGPPIAFDLIPNHNSDLT